MQINGSMLGHIVLVDVRLDGSNVTDRLPMLVTDHRPGGVLSGHLYRNRPITATDFMSDVVPADLDDREVGCWYPRPATEAVLTPLAPPPEEPPAEHAGNGAVTETGEHDDLDPTEEEREHAEAHREEHGKHPWEAYGHSRSWYYAHRRAGTLPPLPAEE